MPSFAYGGFCRPTLSHCFCARKTINKLWAPCSTCCWCPNQTPFTKPCIHASGAVSVGCEQFTAVPSSENCPQPSGAALLGDAWKFSSIALGWGWGVTWPMATNIGVPSWASWPQGEGGDTMVLFTFQSSLWAWAGTELQNSYLGLASSSALFCFSHFLPPESLPWRNHLHKNPASGSASRARFLSLQARTAGPHPQFLLWGLRICISVGFPGDAAAAGPGTTL